MSDKATRAELAEMHKALKDHILDRIKNGETRLTKKGDVVHCDCSPSVLGHAIKFLSDNGVKVDDALMNDGSEIAAKIRKLAEEDDEITYGPN